MVERFMLQVDFVRPTAGGMIAQGQCAQCVTVEGELSGNEVLSLWVTSLEVILQSLLLHSADESI